MIEYDETTCITAKELRTMGVTISDDVPDCAWIPRSSLIPDPESLILKTDPCDSTRFTGTFLLIPTEPFRWIETSFEV